MKKLALVILLFSASCISPRVSVTNVATNDDNAIIDGKLFATAYQQNAAEYRALCYQAYNIARLRVEQNKSERNEKPKAIMTDVDETVLDNSPYQARQVLLGKDYDPASWQDWTSRGEADTVPGALHFLQFAAALHEESSVVARAAHRQRVDPADRAHARQSL